MERISLCFLFIVGIGLASCSTLLNTPKYQFADGYYTAKISGGPNRMVYVDTEEEFIRIYRVKGNGKSIRVDTAAPVLISFESSAKGSLYKALSFRQNSLDVDFL
jgi:hypothetical protein